MGSVRPRLIGRAAELGDPRWSLAPLVALIATERLADLSPAVGRPLLTAIATLAVLFSATSAAGWLRSRDAVRPEHLLPTATAGFTVSLALHGPAAYAAFAAGTLGWLLVAGALTRRGLMWPYPSVITLSPPSLGGLAWLALRDGRVDAIAVAFGIASAATLIRLRVRAGGFAWTAIFPATAAARLLVGLSGTGPAPWIALAAAAGLSAAAMSELVGSLRTDPGDPSRAYE